MKLPFTQQEFLEVFRTYNTAVWPMQLVFFLAGILVLLSTWKQFLPSRFLFFVLAFLWAWMGLVYHLGFFFSINPVAGIFGIVFAVQSLAFLVYGSFSENIAFSMHDVQGKAGFALMIFALFIYPLSAVFTDHAYPSSPTFGLPCPTVIFTLGLLMCANRRFSNFLFLIPLAWSVVGFSAALQLGMFEDISLLLAAFIFLGFRLRTSTGFRKHTHAV
jgi:hypothetical protein